MKFQNFLMQNNLLSRENRLVWLKKGLKQKVIQTIDFGDKGENLKVSPESVKTKLHEGVEKAVRLLQALDKHIPKNGKNLSENGKMLRDHMMKISNVTNKLKSHLQNLDKTNSKQKENIKKHLNKLNALIHKSDHTSTYRSLLRKEKQSSMKEFYNGNVDNAQNLVKMFTLLGKGHGGKTETREFKQNGEIAMTVEKFGDQLFITLNKDGKTSKLNYKFSINENGKWKPQKLSIKEGTVKKTLKTVEAKSETVAEKGISKLKTQLAKLKEGKALQVQLIGKGGKSGISTFVKRGNQIFSLSNGKISQKPYDINDAALVKIMKKKLARGAEFKIIAENDVIKTHHLNRIVKQLANLNGGKKNNLVIRSNGAIIGIFQRIRGHYIDRSNGMIPIFKNPNNKNIRIKNIANAFNDNFKNMLAIGQISVSTIQNRDWRRTEKSGKNLSVAEIANKIQFDKFKRLGKNRQMTLTINMPKEGPQKVTIKPIKPKGTYAVNGTPMTKKEVAELKSLIDPNTTIQFV